MRAVYDLELVTVNRVHWVSEQRLHGSIGMVRPAECARNYYRQIVAEEQPFRGQLASH